MIHVHARGGRVVIDADRDGLADIAQAAQDLLAGREPVAADTTKLPETTDGAWRLAEPHPLPDAPGRLIPGNSPALDLRPIPE